MESLQGVVDAVMKRGAKAPRALVAFITRSELTPRSGLTPPARPLLIARLSKRSAGLPKRADGGHVCGSRRDNLAVRRE